MNAKKRAARHIYKLMRSVEGVDLEAGSEIRLLLATLNAEISKLDGGPWTMADTAYIALLPDGVRDERVRDEIANRP